MGYIATKKYQLRAYNYLAFQAVSLLRDMQSSEGTPPEFAVHCLTAHWSTLTWVFWLLWDCGKRAGPDPSPKRAASKTNTHTHTHTHTHAQTHTCTHVHPNYPDETHCRRLINKQTPITGIPCKKGAHTKKGPRGNELVRSGPNEKSPQIGLVGLHSSGLMSDWAWVSLHCAQPRPWYLTASRSGNVECTAGFSWAVVPRYS